MRYWKYRDKMARTINQWGQNTHKWKIKTRQIEERLSWNAKS